ncbi:MAG: glmZ(sRNA)-inactivating NTPase [Thiotrichales bacterium SG8_50]|nr:MAG: glmZ(sRNA)-inactivating NTPase [Thiotrichales bacterium SG8_50]
MRLVIISGISGSGKSIALHFLEDLGFYCIDNLPVGMLAAFSQYIAAAELASHDRFAVGIDARNLTGDLQHLPLALRSLHSGGLEPEIIFLDADDDTLIKRYSETRRRHPLTSEEVSLPEAIMNERRLLEPLAHAADLRLDTSHTNVHQLRELLRERVGDEPRGRLSLLVESFGYKLGVPVDADFVFDVRCMPNPHWEPSLRNLTGRDQPVIDFLANLPEVDELYQDIVTFLGKWIPRFQADNRSYMTIAVGCTGGQHRSVYFADRIARHFRAPQSNVKVSLRHRELS